MKYTSEERDLFRNLDVDGGYYYNGSLKNYGDGVWTGLIWFRTGLNGEAFVNTVMNIRILWRQGYSLIS
jgi:hypothetical protein